MKILLRLPRKRALGRTRNDEYTVRFKREVGGTRSIEKCWIEGRVCGVKWAVENVGGI